MNKFSSIFKQILEIFPNQSSLLSAASLLEGFWQAIHNIQSLMHPAVLLTTFRINLLKGSPESHGTVSYGQIGNIHTPFDLSFSNTSRQLCVDSRSPSSIARNCFCPRSFTPITTSAHSFVCCVLNPLYTPLLNENFPALLSLNKPSVFSPLPGQFLFEYPAPDETRSSLPLPCRPLFFVLNTLQAVTEARHPLPGILAALLPFSALPLMDQLSVLDLDALIRYSFS